MPFVRSIKDMLEKYRAKYVPDTVGARFTAVKTLMDERYEGATSAIYNVVETVRAILTENAVPPALWGMYIAFGEILARYAFSHSGPVLERLASGLKQYWVTAKGADPTILDKIIEAIIGTVPPY